MIIPLQGALAATSKKDILVAGRALNFIKTKPSGSVSAAIIYDPANPVSKADAETFQPILGDGLKIGKLQLSANLVSVDNLGAISGNVIAFIASGTADHFETIASATAGSGVLLASMDLNCVQSGKCALGVTSSPKVEIYVNQTAASNAGVEFLPAFLMMVKEV